MKIIMSQYKIFLAVIVVEVLFVLYVAVSSLGNDNVTDIELNADNLDIYDSSVVVSDYVPIDSIVQDANTIVVYDNKESLDTEKSLWITGRNDENPFGRYILGAGPLTLTPGVYELEVKYYSLLYDNEVGGNSDDYTGSVQITSDSHDSSIYYNRLVLYDNVTVSTQRVWIRSLKSIDDVQLKVVFNGMGDLRIDSISLHELPMWSVVKLLFWIAIFVALDLLYIYLFTDNNFKNKKIVLALIAIIFFASLPTFVNYIIEGHDLDFHVARIQALAENLKAGNWTAPIQTEIINGYGYATPVFYGQVLLYLPAVLYLLGVPICACVNIYIAFINALTAVIAYYSFDGIVEDKRVAVLGTTLYTLSAYRITDVYLRAAVGEYSAMMFYPLLIYGFTNIYRKEASKICYKECLAVTIGLVGLINTHVLSCEIAALFIIIFCILFAKKTFKPWRFAILLFTAIATILISASFVVPFISYIGTHIRVFENEVGQIQGEGAYLIQLLGVFMTASGATVADDLQGEMPISLGFSLVIGLGIFIVCCVNKYGWKIKNDKLLKVGATCTGFAVLSIIFCLRVFPWDSIEQINLTVAKIFTAIQFPWRYLSLATAFSVVATIVGVKIVKEHMTPSICSMVETILVLCVLLQVGLFYKDYADTANESKVYGGADVIQEIGGGEYMITGTQEGLMRWRSVTADFEIISVSEYESDYGKVTFLCTNTSNEDEFVQIPILNYDNYHAYTESGEELSIETADNKKIGIWVPSNYNGYIRVQYEIPLLWKVSYAITAFMVFGILVSILVFFKKSKTGKTEEKKDKKWYMIASSFLMN